MYTGNSIANLYNLRTSNFTANNVADAIDALQQSVQWGGTTAGTSTAYTCSPTPAWTTLQAGDVVRITPHTTCGASATLQVGSTSAAGIYYMGNTTVGGELASGVEAFLMYDGSSTWNLLNHGGAWASWIPTFSAGGSMTYGTITYTAKFQRHGKLIHFELSASGTTGGTASDTLRFTLPVNANVLNMPLYANIFDATFSGNLSLGQGAIITASTAYVWNRSQANWGLGTSRGMYVHGTYETV